MQLTLHVGAHGTDGGAIAGWLARNRAGLEAQGCIAPPPRLFLARLSAALAEGRDLDPYRREEALLRGLGASGQRRRMVVSAPGLLGSSRDVLAPEGFYVRDVARRLYALRVLFPRSRLRILLAVRRPSALLPALLPEDEGAAASLLPAIRAETLPWARLAGTVRQQLPEAELIAWRHEDLPSVWPRVLAALVGTGQALPPEGLTDFAFADLGAEARLRAERQIATTPPVTAGDLRQVAETFATRFGRRKPEEPGRDLPGWVREQLEDFDADYATEWSDVAGIEGVRVLVPKHEAAPNALLQG